MSEPVTPPPPGPPSQPPSAQASSSKPVTSLVLGIIGLILCCGIPSPFAWYIGKKELDAIAAGQSPQEGQGMARAGMILGIIGTVLLLFSLFWVVLGGGMAVLQGLSGM